MIDGPAIVSALERVGVTHVIGVPDSTIGQWDAALDASRTMTVVRVTREGEAWEIAAGLHLGGAQPLVLIQCTGLFESGDALRNVVHDWKIPVYAIVGYRSYLDQSTLPGDTCLVFTEPIIEAWKIDYRLIQPPQTAADIVAHREDCRRRGVAGVALLAEGKA